MKIVPFGTPENLPEVNHNILNTLDALCFPYDRPYPKEGCYWWVLKNELESGAGLFCGFAGLKVLTGHNKGTGYLCRAGVSEEVEGKGLQRRLIRVRLRKAKHLGLHTVITYTSPDNFPSAMNLLKSGFRFMTPNYKWGCTNAMYFEKAI